MALSMDEQRMLAEIERRLSAEDPRLAAKLSSFRRPAPAGKLRSPRNRVLGSVFTVVLLAVVSLMVYAMVPFRGHGLKSGTGPQASTSAPAHFGTPAASSPKTSPRSTTRGTDASPRTSAVQKTSKTASHAASRSAGATSSALAAVHTVRVAQ